MNKLAKNIQVGDVVVFFDTDYVVESVDIKDSVAIGYIGVNGGGLPYYYEPDQELRVRETSTFIVDHHGDVAVELEEGVWAWVRVGGNHRDGFANHGSRYLGGLVARMIETGHLMEYGLVSEGSIR